MTYNFLYKAKMQPDLADFCDYLEKPLAVLEDIRTRYNQLKSSQQASIVNIELRHKCDSIVETHLPALVENFCNFSFGFRNTEKIRVDSNTFLTPKELLLKNLSSIVEEISEIEKEFNTNNSFATLAQTKVLQQYGAKPQLCLETGEILKNKNKLENQFDYEQFLTKNKFKKKDLSVEAETTKSNKENENSSGSFGIIEIVISLIIVLVFLSMMALAILTASNKVTNKIQEQIVTKNILHLYNGVNSLYENKLSYDGLDKQTVVYDILGDIQQQNDSGLEGFIAVKPATIKEKNDSFSINIPITDKSQKSVCAAVSKSAQYFDIIKVGNLVLKTDASIPTTSVLSQCLSSPQKTDIIDTVSLISIRQKCR